MKKITFLLTLMLLTLGIGSAWGAEYELIATLDCAKASSEGTSELYGSSTSSMSADKVKAYINAAAGKTLISSNPTISGSLYWSKGSGGGEIPNNVFKLGKASGPGSVKFTIDGTDNVVKVVIVGHGWKTSSSISVNSADAQKPSAQYTEQTFVFDNLSPTKDITILVTSSAVCITSIQLYKEASGGGDEPVIIKTLESIAVTGMTTNFEIGETFTFDGTCTATYSVTKDDVAQADETAEVTPTSVSKPDMSTAGTKEVTVTYTEGEITKTFTYNITVENALPKIVITQNEVADFTNTYAEYTWTASGVSGKIYGYKNSGMQLNSSKAGSYVYNTDPIPGYIRKIKIVKAASGTTRNWTPYVSETALTSAEGTVLTQETVATTTTWEVTGENSYFYLLESGGATVIESITIYYEAVAPQVTAPTFNPAAGTYNAVQNVTISAEEGTTIYYTLDGKNPTTDSEVYSSAIEIGETTTVKAIAVKDEKVSPVATATYTINLPLTTMDAIFAKATAVGSTATSVQVVMNNWVVTGVKNSNAYLTDGTKGLIIYTASHGFNVGDILSGTVACKVQLYKGSAELTELTATTEGLTVTTGGAVSPREVTDITTLGGVNTGSVINVTGPCTINGTKYYVAGLELYNSLFAYTNPEAGFNYECTGVYVQFDATQEILPRKAEDLVKIETQQPAGISFAVTEHTAEVGAAEFAEPTLTNPNSLTVTYKTSDETLATVNATTGEVTIGNKEGKVTITASFAGNEDYVEADASYYITITDPNQLEATFVAGTDKSEELSISKDGITVAFTGGVFNRADNYRCYGKESMTISYADGNITKIVIECTANDGAEYGPGQFTTETATYSYSGKVGTWTGEANSVTFTADKQVRMTTITVYYKQDNRAEAGLAWNPATVSLTVGDAFTAPTLSNPNGLTVSFESSNTDLATVNNAGVISLVSGKKGTATITATFAGDENYKAAEVTCVITVSPKSEKVVILAQYNGQWYALKAAYLSGETDRLDAIPVDYVGGKLYNVAEADKASIEWSSVVEGDKVSFLNDGKYLKGKTSTTLLFEEDADGLYQWDNTTYTMTIGTTVRSFLYNGEAFRNFAVSNAGKVVNDILYSSLPVVTAPVYGTGTITPMENLTPQLYGTICLENNVVGFEGITFYAVAGKEDNKVIFDEVTELEAGMPYIYIADSETATIVKGNETAAEAGKHNSLQGTFIQIDPAESNILTGNYILYNNVIKMCGKNCGLKDHKAYFIADELGSLSAPQAQMPGRRRVSLNTTGENAATGIGDVVVPTEQATKVIINGQLIIIRDGEKFNAMGVKL